MGIEWTKEALDALATGIYGERQTYEPDKLRAALDAAVKAQGMDDPEPTLHPLIYSDIDMEMHAEAVRAEALEEAAKVALKVGIENIWAREIAAAIRALKDT